ncbi:MAG TPA: DUF6498-containing protein [Sedimentisphaerales bacterium]|nr:DUF6498-containing protein [Sedimentisphaerales bacterium]
MKLTKKDLSDVPILALLAANTIPLFGVVFLGWDAFTIVLLYWTENVIVGFYNVLKMAFAAVPHPAAHVGKLFLIPFFIVHYGGFTAVHGFFVLALFHKEQGPPMGGTNWPCCLVFVQMLFNVIAYMYSVIPPQVRLAVLALFASHGVSFVQNYLLKGEYLTAKPNELMGSPYGRVVVMHVAILAGGFLTMAIGSPAALLAVLVLLKTILDVSLHNHEHKKAAAKTQAR